MQFFATVVITALIVATASSLAKSNPLVAGLITALPLTSLLALSAMYLQTGDGEATSRYAISIFTAIPVSLLFFVPFLFYGRFKGPFWLYLGVGIGLLYLGSYVHKAVYAQLVRQSVQVPK